MRCALGAQKRSMDNTPGLILFQNLVLGEDHLWCWSVLRSSKRVSPMFRPEFGLFCHQICRRQRTTRHVQTCAFSQMAARLLSV